MFATLTVPQVARAADAEELDYAKSLIDEAQYEQAVKRFERLLEPGAAPCPAVVQLTTAGCRLTEEGSIWRAHSYLGLALALLGRDDEAKAQFKLLLKSNPTFSPSPATFPQKTIELFLEAKKEVESDLTSQALLDQQRRAKESAEARAFISYVEAVEGQAKTEVVVEQRSRWIAAIPFGVGQFMNDDPGLGALFLSVELAALGTSVGTGIAHGVLLTCGTNAESTLCGSEPIEPTSLQQPVDDLRTASIVSSSLLAALMLAGIIEAQVSFEPSVETVRPSTRKLPPKPPLPSKLEMTGVPSAPDAVGLGFQLTF